MTLDEMRPHLIAAMLEHVPFDGWGQEALDAAAQSLAVNPASARLAFPGGAMDMIDTYIAMIDGRMEKAARNLDLAAMPVRGRFAAVITSRLEQSAPHREAIRRALAILGLPGNAVRATKIGWRTADSIWRAMGDRSTDFSFYSRRVTAAAVYAATLLVWLDDESPGFTDTHGFLARRIDAVMRFERAKARLKPGSDLGHFSPLRIIGRLRYPIRNY